MLLDTQLVAALLIFGLIALASRQIGAFFTRIHLPLVTGFLLTGILAGPHILQVVSTGSLARCIFLTSLLWDSLALPQEPISTCLNSRAASAPSAG